MAIKKAYVDIAAGQIHYRMVPGGAGTPLAFYHRTPASAVSFEPMMAMMAGDRPLFAFDTPGFGQSFDSDGMPKMIDYARWMIEALDALDLPSVHIFGYHTGSHIATEMALVEPARVSSLMLNGIAYLTADERAQFKKMMSHPKPPDETGDYLKTTWKTISGLFSDFDPELTPVEYWGALRAMDGRRQIHTAIREDDYRHMLARVTCPILALCAEDDLLRPYFDRVKEDRPDAKWVVTGPARFFSPELDTARTVKEVRGFLTELEKN